MDKRRVTVTFSKKYTYPQWIHKTVQAYYQDLKLAILLILQINTEYLEVIQGLNNNNKYI